MKWVPDGLLLNVGVSDTVGVPPTKQIAVLSRSALWLRKARIRNTCYAMSAS